MTQPSRKRAPYDSLWKALPEEVILALVRSSLPEISAPLTPWKTDLAVVTDRAIDGAFLVEVDGMPLLLHLEYQNYLDASMPQRMHEYASLLDVQYRQQAHTTIPVIPLVIWAIAGKTPPPVYHQERFGKVLCHREYFEVHLAEMDWHEVDPLLLVLAPYLQGVHREDLETIAVRLYEAAPEGQQAVLLGAFLALSERKYANFAAIEQAILQKVRQQMDEILQAIAESSIGTAILERGKAEGEARGKAEGKIEGKIEGEALGKTEGYTAAVQILWQSRFGTMPPEVLQALKSLTEPQMQDLLTLFAAAPSEADVRSRLGL